MTPDDEELLIAHYEGRIAELLAEAEQLDRVVVALRHVRANRLQHEMENR